MAKVRLPWKHRRIQGEQIVTLDCGCKYHCQDKDLQIVRTCEVHHRPGFWAFYNLKKDEIYFKPVPEKNRIYFIVEESAPPPQSP